MYTTIHDIIRHYRTFLKKCRSADYKSAPTNLKGAEVQITNLHQRVCIGIIIFRMKSHQEISFNARMRCREAPGGSPGQFNKKFSIQIWKAKHIFQINALETHQGPPYISNCV